MKGLIILIILGLLSSAGVYAYKEITKTEAQKYDERLAQLQDEVDKATKERQDEELRKIKLQELQNPEIINNKLSEVGKLIVLEGSTQYSDIIKESNFWGSKELDVVLTYNFAIAIDLNQIVVSRFYDKTAVLQIPKDKLLLDYVELNMDETKIQGTKTWFNKEYKPEDVRLILDNAQETTTEELNKNRELFDDALENLKYQLREFVLQLNYDDVVFEEVISE